MRITILGGGTGGAAFLRDIARIAALDVTLTAIVTTANDLYAYGLKSSPDLDAVLTTLSPGDASGTNVVHQLRAFNVEPTWYDIDDRSIALAIVRTEMMASGYSLTDVTAALKARMGIGVTVLPMSNDRIENNVVITDGTDQRAVHVLEYLAKYADRPAEGFVPIGLDKALATTEAVKALAEADLVILGPSSPTLALEPILSLPALYDTLTKSQAKVLGVPASQPDHPGLARAAGVAETAREQFDHLVDRWASGTAAEVLATGRELIAQ